MHFGLEDKSALTDFLYTMLSSQETMSGESADPQNMQMATARLTPMGKIL